MTPASLDVRTRLDELARLKDGWLNGTGVAPSAEGLRWLGELLDGFAPPPPYLYPTADGCVRAEWSIQTWDLSLEIDLRTKEGMWHALDLKDDTELTWAM